MVIPISELTTLVWLCPLAVLYSYYVFWLYPNLDSFCNSLLYISIECLIRVAMPYHFSIMEINLASSLVSKIIRPLITVLCNHTNVSLKTQLWNYKAATVMSNWNGSTQASMFQIKKCFPFYIYDIEPPNLSKPMSSAF